MTDFVTLLSSCPSRFYTISGSLRDTLPPKEAHIEMWGTARLCDPPPCSTLDILPSSLCPIPLLGHIRVHYDVIGHSPLLPVVLLLHFKPTLETLYSCWDFCWSVELRSPWCWYNIHVTCCASFTSTFFSVIETHSHMCCWLIAVLFYRLKTENWNQSFQSKIQILHLFLTVFLDWHEQCQSSKML